MFTYTHSLIAATLLLAAAIPTAPHNARHVQATDIKIYWSPAGGAATAIANQINTTNATIRIAMYSLSEPQITGALIAAHARKVNTQILVTPSQQNDAQSTCPKLRKAGILIRVDATHPLMHNKYAILDDKTVITGSMNWSAAGDRKNAENTLIITDPATAAEYTADWHRHWAHTTPFTARHHDHLKPLPYPQPPIPTPKPRPQRSETLWHAPLSP